MAQLGHPLTGSHAFRQTQTAFAVREYALHGINLLDTPLPVFGAQRDVPFEFPAVQAVASIVTKLGASAELATRLVGLASFQVSGLLLFVLLRRWVGPRVGLLALVLFQATPFALLWGASSLIDFSSVALGLVMVAFLDSWFRSGSTMTLVAGWAATWLLVLVKVTSAPTAGVLLLLAAWLHLHRVGWVDARRRLVVGALLVPASALGPLVLWTHHADAVKERSPLTAPLTSSGLRSWNFGTMSQRVDPASYEAVLQRLAQEVFGTVGVVLVLAGLVLAVRQRHVRAPLVGFGCAALASPLVFFNLFVVHSYYLIAVYPAAVALIALGVESLVSAVPRSPRTVALPALMVVAALATTAITPGGLADIAEFTRAVPRPELSAEIDRVSAPVDQIVLADCDWDPEVLFHARRTGLMIRPGTEGAAWRENDVRDFRFLATCAPDRALQAYLPAGFQLTGTAAPDVYRIARAR